MVMSQILLLFDKQNRLYLDELGYTRPIQWFGKQSPFTLVHVSLEVIPFRILQCQTSNNQSPKLIWAHSHKKRSRMFRS